MARILKEFSTLEGDNLARTHTASPSLAHVSSAQDDEGQPSDVPSFLPGIGAAPESLTLAIGMVATSAALEQRDKGRDTELHDNAQPQSLTGQLHGSQSHALSYLIEQAGELAECLLKLALEELGTNVRKIVIFATVFILLYCICAIFVQEDELIM